MILAIVAILLTLACIGAVVLVYTSLNQKLDDDGKKLTNQVSDIGERTKTLSESTSDTASHIHKIQHELHRFKKVQKDLLESEIATAETVNNQIRLLKNMESNVRKLSEKETVSKDDIKAIQTDMKQALADVAKQIELLRETDSVNYNMALQALNEITLIGNVVQIGPHGMGNNIDNVQRVCLTDPAGVMGGAADFNENHRTCFTKKDVDKMMSASQRISNAVVLYEKADLSGQNVALDDAGFHDLNAMGMSQLPKSIFVPVGRRAVLHTSPDIGSPADVQVSVNAGSMILKPPIARNVAVVQVFSVDDVVRRSEAPAFLSGVDGLRTFPFSGEGRYKDVDWRENPTWITVSSGWVVALKTRGDVSVSYDVGRWLVPSSVISDLKVVELRQVNNPSRSKAEPLPIIPVEKPVQIPLAPGPVEKPVQIPLAPAPGPVEKPIQIPLAPAPSPSPPKIRKIADVGNQFYGKIESDLLNDQPSISLLKQYQTLQQQSLSDQQVKPAFYMQQQQQPPTTTPSSSPPSLASGVPTTESLFKKVKNMFSPPAPPIKEHLQEEREEGGENFLPPGSLQCLARMLTSGSYTSYKCASRSSSSSYVVSGNTQNFDGTSFARVFDYDAAEDAVPWVSSPNYDGDDEGSYDGPETTSNVDDGAESIAGDWVEIAAPEPVALSTYDVGVGTADFPTAFVLLASHDGERFKTIDSRHKVQFRSGETKRFEVDDDGSYRFFRLVVTNAAPDGIFRMRTLRFSEKKARKNSP